MHMHPCMHVGMLLKKLVQMKVMQQIVVFFYIVQINYKIEPTMYECNDKYVFT